MTTYVDRNFTGSVALVARTGDKISGALKDARYGQSVLDEMSPTFAQDLEAAVSALLKRITDQSGAEGDVTSTAGDQSDNRADCLLSVGTARSIAKLTFRGQDALLHSEFTVGEHAPSTMTDIIVRAEKVHAACVKHAEALAGNGWSAAATTKLANQIAALKGANDARTEATAAKLGATAQQRNMANAVYHMIRCVQIVANQIYPAADMERDGSIREARELYLLGVFPPRSGDDAPADAPGTGDGATANPPVANAGGGTTGAGTSAGTGGAA